jgi:hypothetical protein
VHSGWNECDVRRCLAGAAGESVRCNAGSEEQHEQSRKAVSLERGSGAEIATESACAGARRRADERRGRYTFNHLCELSLGKSYPGSNPRPPGVLSHPCNSKALYVCACNGSFVLGLSANLPRPRPRESNPRCP